MHNHYAAQGFIYGMFEDKTLIELKKLWNGVYFKGDRASAVMHTQSDARGGWSAFAKRGHEYGEDSAKLQMQ
ncbi:MAG: hypothetical protein HC850_08205 [Rhodomicrobium sp.]|nr:hypothetical protein [Rhodomicrobium sp.]